MPKPPREVNGFIALPLSLPVTKAHPHETTHYLYLKPHDPAIPSEDASRSLFLVSIPVTTTVQSLKDLLTTRLEGGLIENIQFSQNENENRTPAIDGKKQRSRKRKRMTAEEISYELDSQSHLPQIWQNEIHKSGSTAIVVFVDRTSMEVTLKAARRAARHGVAITGGEEKQGHDDSMSSLPSTALVGLSRYESHKTLQFPPRATLLRAVNAYMTSYAALESTRSATSARTRAIPDEEGFVTVTRGSKGVARMDEAKEVAEKQREKEKEKASGMGDFYRFQNREKRKSGEEGVRKKFEEDKARVEEMRKRRRMASG